MSTPVGHILGCLAAYEGAKHTILRKDTPRRYWLWLVVMCAVLPDLDHIALILVPRLEEYMHGPTHSLLACGLLAAAIAAVLKCVRSRVSAWRIFVVFMLCAVMHPLQDYFMGVGPPIEFFWPILGQGWLAPIPLQPTSFYAHSGSKFLALLWYPPTLKAIAFEIAAFLPLIMIWQVKSKKHRACLAITAVAVFAAIYFTYQPSKRYWDMKGAERQKQMIEQRVEKARESNQEMHRTK